MSEIEPGAERSEPARIVRAEHPRISYRSALRLFGGAAGGAMREATETLEMSAPVTEPPRVVSAPVIEGTTLEARPVTGEAIARFAAFLDGIQRSRVVHYVDGAPIVYGSIGAIVRRRVDRRLSTWRAPIVRGRIYVPRAIAPYAWDAANQAGWDVRDTGESVAVDPTVAEEVHPYELLTRAVHAVQDDRQNAERVLAESWCAAEREPLYLDGGLSRSETLARAANVVGVVKSHRSLYAAGDAMRTVLALGVRERSSVFRVSHAGRHPVASWYLRVHDPLGRDPMWGLVRIEVAEPVGASAGALSMRADEVSRWVCAESAPLALPDGRWDRMAYGIRDCEQTLRARMG